MKAGEIDFDAERDCFIYVEGGEQFQLKGENEIDSEGDEDEERKSDSDY